MKITKVPEYTGDLDAGHGIDDSTTEILSYGDRSGNSESENDLTQRLHHMRDLAFKFAENLIEEGYTVDPRDLKVIDVELEVTETKRLHL